MNIVNKLTVRHLKQNKRRTLVTIIGVIISVAMVTAVTTLGTSFMDLLKRQTIAEDGEWHVTYNDVQKEQIAAIKKDEDSKNVILSNDLGYAPLEGSQNDSKPYLFIREYSKEGFKQFPIKLSEGRLPENEKEIVITESVETNAKVKFEIGDQLKLNVGERVTIDEAGKELILSQQYPLEETEGKINETLQKQEARTYTIVGVIERPTWEPTWSPGYTALSYVDETLLSGNDSVDAVVVLEKIKRSLYEHAEKLAEQHGIESFKFNNQLLRYYGVTDDEGLNRMLSSLIAIIMGVIIIGSVALIYNAFAISVSERSRHLGMLSSVGATKRQKRNSVFFEGVIIGAISIPLGLLSGIAGIGVTFLFINKAIMGALGLTVDFKLAITPWSILLACVISAGTIFISTYLPARRASKITAIDAIRQTTDIKLTGKRVKTSKLVRRVFGIEAEIGLKNLKRNKRRYQVTVFSLVISIVLFLAVSFFTDSLKKSLVLSQDGVNFDIQVSMDNESDEKKQELFESIEKLPDVTEASVLSVMDLTTLVDVSDVPEELKETIEKDKSVLENGKYPYFVILNGLDEASFKKYAKQVGADINQLNNTSQLSGIVIETSPYQDVEKRKYVETKAVYTKVGEKIELFYSDSESGERVPLNMLEVAATTDELPMGVFPAGVSGVNVIVPKQVIEELKTEELEASEQSVLFLKTDDALKTQQEIEEMSENLDVFNVYKYRQQEEQLVMLMSVFTYGFIVLITLISIANIFNTISTSISLRKREFAMLKSVGMTAKGFNKMMSYESIFYGLKALLYGIPISMGVMFLIYKGLMNSFSYSFFVPWLSLVICLVTVFVIVGSAMLYSISKVKKENIIDALKQENI